MFEQTEKRYPLQVPVLAGVQVHNEFAVTRGVVTERKRPERTQAFVYVDGIGTPIYQEFNPRIRGRVLGYANAAVAAEFHMQGTMASQEGGFTGYVDGVFLMFKNQFDRIGLEQEEETTGQPEPVKKVMDLYERILTRIFCESFTSPMGENFPGGQLINRLLNVPCERIFEADMLLLQALGSLDGMGISAKAHALMEDPGTFKRFGPHHSIDY